MTYEYKPTKTNETATGKIYAMRMKAKKEYHKYGFHSIARDEGRHAKYFKKLKEERY